MKCRKPECAREAVHPVDPVRVTGTGSRGAVSYARRVVKGRMSELAAGRRSNLTSTPGVPHGQEPSRKPESNASPEVM